ncbi:MAG: hypothetical protein IJC92_05935 [Bacteroidaceae bacterium]|nr:hypothetical protein [Bacteroidaceae bacterium]
MIKHIKPLPVSEEMLGAYIEGNLTQNDAQYVEQMLQSDDELSAFVNELSVSDNLTLDSRMEDLPSFDDDFTLPEVSTETGTCLEPHVLPFGFEPSFADVAACACMPDIADDGDMIINDNLPNTDADNISDIGMDINSEVLPTDGE